MSISKQDCSHDILLFGSGQYYVICKDCNAMWGRLKPGQQEYAWIDGKMIGCSPEEANSSRSDLVGTYRVSTAAIVKG